jgi:hypothetical protein
MDAQPAHVALAADFRDDWARRLAGVLPRWVLCLDQPRGIPRQWPPEVEHLNVLVVHRSWLGAQDLEGLQALRRQPTRPGRVVLCLGSLARYMPSERASLIVDSVVSEATALEVLPRWAGIDPLRPDPPEEPLMVGVVSGLYETRMMLTEALGAAGLRVQPARDWSELPADMPCVWDAPVLQPDWLNLLERHAANRPLVVLAGFADRAMVAACRDRGAAAVLDWPVDPADLAYVVQRVARDPGTPPETPAGTHTRLRADSPTGGHGASQGEPARSETGPVPNR